MMKKTIYMIAAFCILLPSIASSQDKVAQQKLMRAGYLLTSESNKLRMLRADLSEIKKKLIVINSLDEIEICHITMLIENIFLTETICMYEGILLGIMASTQEPKKLELYQFHHSRLRKDLLKRLYLNYKSTQLHYTKINAKEAVELADKAREEMITSLRVIEEVIDILQNPGNSNP